MIAAIDGQNLNVANFPAVCGLHLQGARGYFPYWVQDAAAPAQLKTEKVNIEETDPLIDRRVLFF